MAGHARAGDGLRRGEILALRWRNVDLTAGAIRVVESLEQAKAGLRFKSTKSEKGRGVALPSFATAELRRDKQAQAETRCLLLAFASLATPWSLGGLTASLNSLLASPTSSPIWLGG